MFTYKMGRLPREEHPNTLRLERFLKEDAPLPDPAKVYWEYKLPLDDLGMFKNDEVGCCTMASKAHIIMNHTAHTGTMFRPTDEQIIEAYSGLTGYDPRTGANDTGASMVSSLEYWRTTGIAGHKILGWLQFDVTNYVHFDQVIYLFAAADCGVNVPQSALDQFAAALPWSTVKRDGGIVGGHDVPFWGYGSVGRKCCTWARNQGATHGWIYAYLDEGYGVISEDWFDVTSGLAPNRFNKDALWAAVKALQVTNG
jgi:hypothetical protein